MNYKTLCRNPDCLAPLSGPAPAKLYCDDTCKASAIAWSKTATRDQHINFEDRFVAKFTDTYNSPCFGIEVEYQ